MSEDRQTTQRNGLLAGLGAYVLWGLLPIYFKLLKDVTPTELVAHRILWSVVFLTAVMAGMRLYPALLQTCRQPKLVAALALSSLLIAANWSIFMWAIVNGHLVASSLGYFLNPLVNVVIGTLVLKESLRRGQLVAVLIAGIAVAILAAGEIETLWISLGLALTFSFYGLVRKLTPVPSAVGLAIETAVLAGPAIAVLFWLSTHGGLAFGRGPFTTLGLIGTGAATSIPLILFAVAARSLPFVTLGLMQYVAPLLQFLTGVFLYHESLSPERWASFLLIWAALVLFVWDSLRGARQARTATT